MKKNKYKFSIIRAFVNALRTYVNDVKFTF